MTLFWVMVGVLGVLAATATGLAMVFVIILMTQLIMDALFNGWFD